MVTPLKPSAAFAPLHPNRRRSPHNHIQYMIKTKKRVRPSLTSVHPSALHPQNVTHAALTTSRSQPALEKEEKGRSLLLKRTHSQEPSSPTFPVSSSTPDPRSGEKLNQHEHSSSSHLRSARLPTSVAVAVSSFLPRQSDQPQRSAHSPRPNPRVSDIHVLQRFLAALSRPVGAIRKPSGRAHASLGRCKPS